MTRITISLPEHVAAALSRESRRKGIPVSRIVRKAVENDLGLAGGAKKLPFTSLGRSGQHSTAADMEELMKAEWTTLDRDS